MTPTPAGALSNPDADNLERMFARGQTVRMKLLLTPRDLGTTTSGNVVGEITSRFEKAGLRVVASKMVQLSEREAAPLVAAGRLERVLPDWCLPTMTVWGVTPGRRLTPARVTAFLDAVRAALGAHDQP